MKRINYGAFKAPCRACDLEQKLGRPSHSDTGNKISFLRLQTWQIMVNFRLHDNYNQQCFVYRALEKNK